jgi:hypothetical protein
MHPKSKEDTSLTDCLKTIKPMIEEEQRRLIVQVQEAQTRVKCVPALTSK